MMKTIYMISVVLFILSCIACSPKTTTLRTFTVTTDSNANRNMAAEIDIVFVSDDAVVKMLPKNSLAWFAQRNEIMSGHTSTVRRMSLQIPPNKSIEKSWFSFPDNWYDAVFVSAYVKYFDKAGQNQLNLTSFKNAHISLKENEIEFGEFEK